MFSFKFLFTNFKKCSACSKHVPVLKNCSQILKIIMFSFFKEFWNCSVSTFCSQISKKNWAVQKCSRFQKLFAIFKNVHVFIFSGDLKIVQFKIFRKCSCFHIFQICSRFQFLSWNLKKFPFQKNVPDFCKHFVFFLQISNLLVCHRSLRFF